MASRCKPSMAASSLGAAENARVGSPKRATSFLKLTQPKPLTRAKRQPWRMIVSASPLSNGFLQSNDNEG